MVKITPAHCKNINISPKITQFSIYFTHINPVLFVANFVLMFQITSTWHFELRLPHYSAL